MLTNKRGFTLIEMLFVLMIICLLSSLSITIYIPHKTDAICVQEISHFFSNAKLYAMVHKQKIMIDINSHIISYSINQKNYQYQLMEGTSIDNYELSFNEYGHIQGAKTLTYHGLEDDYSFVFQVGSGYFYVES